jgi:hypothetical protein
VRRFDRSRRCVVARYAIARYAIARYAIVWKEEPVSEEKKEPPRKQMNVQIEADDAIAQGIYTNFTLINHNETEFVVDFVYVQPNTPRAKVRSRVIMSPKHARQFLAAFTRNIEMYEKKFGTIARKKTAKGAAPPDDSSIVH